MPKSFHAYLTETKVIGFSIGQIDAAGAIESIEVPPTAGFDYFDYHHNKLFTRQAPASQRFRYYADEEAIQWDDEPNREDFFAVLDYYEGMGCVVKHHTLGSGRPYKINFGYILPNGMRMESAHPCEWGSCLKPAAHFVRFRNAIGQPVQEGYWYCLEHATKVVTNCPRGDFIDDSMINEDQDDTCFACGRRLGKTPALVDTRDDQKVYVGRECFKYIVAAGEDGYQPPTGGPRLYVLKKLTESIIRQICMYCNRVYGEKDGLGRDGDSHGICPTCLELSDEELDQIARAKKKPAPLARFETFIQETVHPNLLQYLSLEVQKQMMGRKDLSRAAAKVVKKFNGSENLFLGGKVNMTVDDLIDAFYQDKARDLLHDLPKYRDKDAAIITFVANYGLDRDRLESYL